MSIIHALLYPTFAEVLMDAKYMLLILDLSGPYLSTKQTIENNSHGLEVYIFLMSII